MKRLACITLLFIASFTQAQERMHSKQKMQDVTPEEMAQLQTKQMTLDLDLTETQQKQIQIINLENAQARKANYESRKNKSNASEKEKPSKEERIKMKNDLLDRQIEIKKKMKDILNDDQYAKWEKRSQEKRNHRQKSMHHKNKPKMDEQKK